MAFPYRPPVNYRGAGVRIGAPEAITVQGGVALLSEAPADPFDVATPIAVTIGGNPRTLVQGAPGAGEVRVLTQNIIGADGQVHVEYLPLLQLNAADEGLAGTADYYQTGTVFTAEWVASLIAFLTPLVGYASVAALPAPTTNPFQRGRAGDVAYLTDSSVYFSDGSAWNLIGQVQASFAGALSVAAAMAMAQDAGYAISAGTTLALLAGMTSDAVQAEVAAQTLAHVAGLSGDAAYGGPLAWDDSTTLAATLAQTMDAVQDEVAALTLAHTAALALDATQREVGAITFGATAAHTPDASWAADETAPSISDPVPGTGAEVAAGNATIDIPYPTGTVAGSTLLMLAYNIAPSALTDWTWYQDSGSSAFVGIKRATGTLAGNLTVAVKNSSGYLAATGRMYRFEGVSAAPSLVSPDATLAPFSGTSIGGTAGVTISAGDMMLLAGILTSGDPVGVAWGSVDSITVGAYLGTQRYALAWKTAPTASGAQDAPNINGNGVDSMAGFKWTAALKVAPISISDPVAGAGVYSASSGSVALPYPTGVVNGSTLIILGSNVDTSLHSDWTWYQDASLTFFIGIKRAAGVLTGTMTLYGQTDPEAGSYPLEAVMLRVDGVSASPMLVSPDAAMAACSGTNITGTSGITISAGDMMFLAYIGSGLSMGAAGGSIDTAGVYWGTTRFLWGWKTAPSASGAQGAPTLALNSVNGAKWTAALKKA